MKSSKENHEYEQIINSLDLAVLTMDLSGNIVYTNKKMQELLTLYPQAKGTKCFEVCRHIWSESGTKFCSWCGIDDVARTGRPANKIVKGKDDKQWLFSWAPLYDENQIITRVVKTIIEITDPIREKSYLESLLMDIFAIMPIGIMIVNAESQIVFLNPAMEKRWGLSISQVIGTNIHELEIYGHSNSLEQGFDSLNKGIKSDKIELEVERHDGDKYWVSCQLIPFKKDKLGWQGILLEEDLTQLSRDKLFIEQDLKQKEAMLISQDKLAAVGQLAAGIAHELNTPITYVRGNMQTFEKYAALIADLITSLKQDVSSVEKETILNRMEKLVINMKEISDSSFTGTSRVMKIISSMKSFVQTDTAQINRINVYEPLQDALILVFNRIKYSGKVFVNKVLFSTGSESLTKSFAAIKIHGAAMRITQLFIILFNNAIDAWKSLPEKEKSPLRIDIILIEQKGIVKIEVTDNAGGISKEVLDKIFDPFFTTRSTKGGTGLGLSIAKQITAEHHCTLKVKNRPGHGVTFTITTDSLGGE